jgi:hypothetical protein
LATGGAEGGIIFTDQMAAGRTYMEALTSHPSGEEGFSMSSFKATDYWMNLAHQPSKQRKTQPRLARRPLDHRVDFCQQNTSRTRIDKSGLKAV